MKVFHIDTGRKYFSLTDLLEITDIMSEENYDALELSIGNGGMRFLLDNMTIETGSNTYASDAVTAAVKKGNRGFHDCGTNELTEQEMETLVAHCRDRKLGIIPLLNSPGHMDAIVTAMEGLNIPNVRFKNSASTIDLSNPLAVEFTVKYVEKYIEWFAKRGADFFNLGCDEYANDVLTSGFSVLTSGDGKAYDAFIEYVNRLAGIVKKNNMTPIMFNDGMYYKKIVPGVTLDKDIICSYWSLGWPGYEPAPARFVEEMGHKILNTNNNWYYVLGRRPDSKDNNFCIDAALKGIATVGHEEVIGGNSNPTVGEMMCLWCDEPGAEYNEQEKQFLKRLLIAF